MERQTDRYTSRRAFKAALLGAAAIVIASTALAQANHRSGTMRAPFATAHVAHGKALEPAKGQPFRTYKGASYATGGTGMRNRSSGSINISGVSGPVQDAWVYWSELVTTAAPKHQKLKIIRRAPVGGTLSVVVTGDLIATPADPCWGSTNAVVYRAQVPTGVANGNGVYQIVMSSSESAVTDGSDPWVGGVVFPAAEGASLVLIGVGSSNVYLYDFFTSEVQSSTLTYTLLVPNPLGAHTTLDSFGADGQMGLGSRLGDPADSGETVSVNSTQITGPGAAFDTDSDWNGNSGFPLPQLWDDNGHDISLAAQQGATAVNIAVTAPSGGDCIIPIGNVLGSQ